MNVCGIKKSYKDKTVLKNIQFSIAPGECVALLGANGCGKSTLLSILAGVTLPDEGQVLWETEDLLKNKSLREKLIGYVPQGNPLYEELTARDNLLLWYTKSELQKELAGGGKLHLLGIPDFLNVKVAKMSGGMKKRLAIGCCICDNPKLLLLDEPSASLDLLCKQQIHAYLSGFLKQGGSVLLVSHDLMDLSICNRFYYLKDGVVSSFDYDGDIQTILTRMQ